MSQEVQNDLLFAGFLQDDQLVIWPLSSHSKLCQFFPILLNQEAPVYTCTAFYI